MKRIEINTIITPDLDTIIIDRKKYCVSLGNGSRTRFGSKRDALTFLADTNRFLSQQMMILNLLMADIYSEYRSIWPYLKHDKPIPQENLVQKAHSLRAAFRNAEDSLELAVGRSGSTNGNHFTFSHLKKVIVNMEDVLEICTEFYRTRSHGVHASQLLRNQMELDGVSERLDNWAKNTNGYRRSY